MKSLAKLKDDARRHEQREQWQDAIDLYLKVLRSAEDGETDVDLPLYNRVGDLYVRLGRPAEAVRFYEQAADKYADAGLFNNAIALCNKALRYLPNRISLYRKLGRFSARQGFLTDARRWFLEYAEHMFASGNLDEAFAALEDFADVTDDPEVRADYARRLVRHERPKKAVEEFHKAFAAFAQAGDQGAAHRLRDEARQLLPDEQEIGALGEEYVGHAQPAGPELPGYVDEPSMAATEEPIDDLAASTESDEVVPLPSYDDVASPPLPGYDRDAAPEPAYTDEVPAPDFAADDAPIDGLETAAVVDDLAGLDAPLDGYESTTADVQDVDAVPEIEGLDSHRPEEETYDEPAAPLPLLGESSESEEWSREPLDEAEEDASPLPLLDSPAADDRNADDLYGVATVDFSQPPATDEPLPAFDPEPLPELSPPEEAAQPAHGEAAARADEPGPGELPGFAPPPAVPSDYVDLLAFINPEEDRVRATRFFVEEKPPTGDEDRDFAEMLAEFKAKVAAHVGEDDSGSHYDLGLAFKEMGLIDEAIGEFQMSLRAGANRLKVFEELGQCFILKRQATIAVKILARALQIEHQDELEMIGVYYHLGRAYEDMGKIPEARDAYERVLGLDIGFMDVMDRVARL